MAFAPKSAVQVEVYLGPRYRGNNKAVSLIAPIVENCKISCGCTIREKGDNTRHYDMVFGHFFDGDERADKLAAGINALEGICAKVVALKV